MNSTPSTLLSAVTSSSSTIAVSNSSLPTCLVCRSIPSSLLFSLVFGVIVLIGVCGNAFVVAVIVNDRKLLNSPVNQFLLNLAIADIGHLLFCSPDMALVIIDQGWILPYVSCRILRFLQEYFLYSSVLLQMSIGIERFMAICSPLRMQRFSRRTTVSSSLRALVTLQIVVALVVWAVALAFATPYFLWQGILLPRNRIPYCGWDRDISKDFKTIFKWAEFVGLYAFPLILLTVLYTIMGRVLWGTTGDAIADETQQAAILKLRRTVVKMLIISMFLYFLCYTPIQGIFIWESIYQRSVKMDSWLRLALNAFSVSSSSANPIIYIICCRHFHTRFVSLIRQISIWTVPSQQSGSEVRLRGEGRLLHGEPLLSFTICLFPQKSTNPVHSPAGLAALIFRFRTCLRTINSSIAYLTLIMLSLSSIALTESVLFFNIILVDGSLCAIDWVFCLPDEQHADTATTKQIYEVIIDSWKDPMGAGDFFTLQNNNISIFSDQAIQLMVFINREKQALSLNARQAFDTALSLLVNKKFLKQDSIGRKEQIIQVIESFNLSQEEKVELSRFYKAVKASLF